MFTVILPAAVVVPTSTFPELSIRIRSVAVALAPFVRKPIMPVRLITMAADSSPVLCLVSAPAALKKKLDPRHSKVPTPSSNVEIAASAVLLC
jgi:hypothetical protein